MPGEFFDASGAIIPATGGSMPFDWNAWASQNWNKLKTDTGQLFAGTPQSGAALTTLLGSAGAAVGPEGSWQQKLGGLAANMGKTQASQLQTKGVGGGPTATPLVNTNNQLTGQVVNASTPPADGSGLNKLANTAQGIAQQTSSIPVAPSAALNNQTKIVGPGPGRAGEGTGVVQQPGAPAPAPAPTAVAPQPVVPQPTAPQPTGAPPVNFPVAPAQVPSLEGQVPSAIGQGAGAASDVDSSLLALGLGDPKTFQDNYKMISEARSREMQGAAHLGQAFEKFRPGQVDYKTEKFGGDIIGMQKALETTRLHGEIQDALANNDIARIEARSREYDALPLNPTMQKKFGVQNWGQLMRANPQMIQAYGAQLQWDATMASVYEQAKGRMQSHDHMMWMATQKDLANYADKYTPQEWEALAASDPKRAQAIMDNYGARGQIPYMTTAEHGNYQQSAVQMDALSKRLGLPEGHADRARQSALANNNKQQPESVAAVKHRAGLEATEDRAWQLRARDQMLGKYFQIPQGPYGSEVGGVAPFGYDPDTAFKMLLQQRPELAQEYDAILKSRPKMR